MKHLVGILKLVIVLILTALPIFLHASTIQDETLDLNIDASSRYNATNDLDHNVGTTVITTSSSSSRKLTEKHRSEISSTIKHEIDSNAKAIMEQHDHDTHASSISSSNNTRFSNSSNNIAPLQDQDVIVIATLDGTFYGISSRTGDTLWKTQPLYNLNHHSSTKTSTTTTTSSSTKMQSMSQNEHLFTPLVSTSTTRTNNKTWRTAAVPSIDGRVFLTLGKSVKDTITTSVRELVEKSPFMDSRGRFFVSNKKSFAVALNKYTGEVVQRIASEKGNLEKDQLVYLETDDSFVWVGRVDYEVTVHDARTGEVDVQFSTSEVLGVEDMMQNIVEDYDNTHMMRESTTTMGPKTSSLSSTSSSSSSSSPPNSWTGISIKEMSSALSKGLNQNVQNSLSSNIFEQEMHQISEGNDSFSTIIATPGGRFSKRDLESGKIEWISDLILSSPVAFAIEDTGKSLGVYIIPDAPVSSLFSEEYLISELDRENEVGRDNRSATFDDETVFGALQNGELFAIPLGSKSKRIMGSGRNGLPHVPRLSSTIGSNKALPAKLPHVSGHGDLLNAVKESSALTTVLKSSPCDQYSTNFAECLRSTYGALLETLDEAPYEDQIAAVDIFKDFQRKKGRKPTKSNFVRIMTSWLPPVVALIFVLSFELGRREKARVIAQESSTASISFKRELSDEDIKSKTDQTGVINVSEQVLGYGGHGTVVYKGKLDGRFVAVKRMLKAYHASADREISLLIESDGHPNVVRYFLKEIRGDFVYLALELCDMSLQDLIVALSKHRIKMQVEDSNVIHDSTRKILFQIASGVKHIHSLRIVHRDLKPANILVARKSRKSKSKASQPVDEDEMYQAFEAGEYIPKISDMGLGKQLTGQSSFGFSTFNSMGPDLMGNDASTIAGAGPGSVGWQAPEVMAQRLTPESFLEDGSGPESWLEASPIDISLNVRTSRSVDIFSLGCIFYCTLLPGSHPFGQWYEREANIMKGNTSTDALKDISMEAWDLVSSMLSRNPSTRPTAAQICSHPFFWNSAKRLLFLCEFSDRLETDTDNTTPGSHIVDKFVIERQASKIIGTSWHTKIDSRLFNNVQKFRSYDTSSVRDCLRLLRNKHHHFDELPSDLKESVIPTQGSLLQYFEDKFPNLLYHCYSICREYLVRDDPLVVKYDIVRKHASRFSLDDNTTQISSGNSRLGTHSTVSSDPIKMNDHQDTTSSILEERNDFEMNVPDLNHEVENEFNDPIHPTIESSHVVTIQQQEHDAISKDIIVWQSSTISSSLNCRGWTRSEDEWVQRTNEKPRKRDPNLVRCLEDPKFRTRLCNHWENSNGVFCPMLKKHKCIFAHNPAELRVKDGKRGRWGKLVDVHGNANNPFHSGGEDTYGAAKSIESARKEEGKWKPPSMGKKKKHLNHRKE